MSFDRDSIKTMLQNAIRDYLKEGNNKTQPLMTVRAILNQYYNTINNLITPDFYLQLVRDIYREIGAANNSIEKGRERYLRAYGLLIFYVYPLCANPPYETYIPKKLSQIEKIARGAKKLNCPDSYHILGTIADLRKEYDKAKVLYVTGMALGCGLCQAQLASPEYLLSTDEKIQILSYQNGHGYPSTLFELAICMFEKEQFDDGLQYLSTVCESDKTQFYKEDVLKKILACEEKFNAKQLKSSSTIALTLNEPNYRDRFSRRSEEIAQVSAASQRKQRNYCLPWLRLSIFSTSATVTDAVNASTENQNALKCSK